MLNLRKSWRSAAAMTATATLLAGCGGGASDVAGGSSTSAAQTTLTLVAYAVPEPGWSKIIPAFAATPEGKGVGVTTSYGASGDHSRAAQDGKPADIVNFSVEPDVTRLVKANKVDKDWNADTTKGIPFGSVVSLVVRKGNPKHIKDWDDLLQPGLEVVTPSPLSSGSAKWNLLAPYAAKSNGGQDQQAGLAFIEQLVKGHVKTHPASGRDASEAFTQGTGDVLLSYENEALNLKGQGKKCTSSSRTNRSRSRTRWRLPAAPLTRKRPRRSTTSSTPSRRRNCGPRPDSDPSTRAWRRNSPPNSSHRGTSSGQSPILGDGAPSTPRYSTRRTGRSPSSTTRPPDERRPDQRRMTASVEPNPEAIRPELIKPRPRRAGAAGGTTRRRVGVATLWLSGIVLLPFAVVLW